MERNFRKTSEEWIELYQQQRNSGMKLRQWCEQNGLNPHTMSDRISRLRKIGMITDPRPPGGRYSTPVHQEITSKQKWIEVKKPDKEQLTFSVQNDNAEMSCGIGIEIGRFKLTLGKNFCEETLARLCKTLVSI